MIRRIPVPTVLTNGLAVASLLLSLAPGPRWPWLAVTWLAVAAGWWAGRPPRLGDGLPARVAVAAGVLIQWTHAAPGTPWSLFAGGALLAGVLLAEQLVYRAARPVFRAANLPPTGGRTLAPALGRLVDDGTAWLVNSGAVALAGLFAALRWPAWTLLLPVVAAAGLTAAVMVDAFHRRRTGHAGELTRLRAAVAAHQPRFLLYFAAPPNSEYQVTMWLPYLQQIGAPFVVVLAEDYHLASISAATPAPVVVHRTTPALEATIAPTMRAAFYVNFGMKNAHCVRFSQLTHVQLYHGYSDKPVSVNPIATIFDRIFVPGQAIIDQFAASGVEIPKERFRIVGRPQAASLAVASRPIGEITEPVVLYAPTWAGEYADSNYCSLPIAERIISALLARGVTVMVRPHPYTRRDPRSMAQLARVEQLLARDRAATGRRHRWGPEVTRLSLTDCMNQADALICDVSSVGTQFVYTEKPLAVTDMVTDDTSFAGSLPLGRAAYLIRRDTANLAEVLEDLLVRDPAAARRRELRGYLLGDFPPDRYVDGFLTEARSVVTGG
ncbi:MAG TPA: CDP-glycerol glycerophosphotransferase family protein [Natronosporangium sp.]